MPPFIHRPVLLIPGTIMLSHNIRQYCSSVYGIVIRGETFTICQWCRFILYLQGDRKDAGRAITQKFCEVLGAPQNVEKTSGFWLGEWGRHHIVLRESVGIVTLFF